MISWAVFDENNQPLASLPIGPGGVELIDYIDEGLVSRTRPAIQNLGGGLYGFQPTAQDLQDGVAYMVRNGGGFPSYVSGAVTTPARPMMAWALFDADGVPWTGAPSTVSTYVGPTPTPTVQAVRPHLMLLRVSAAADVSVMAQSPSGAEPPFASESFNVGLAPLPIAPTSASPVCTPVPNDLSGVIEMLASGCYTVTRRNPTTMLQGRRVPPTSTSFTIVASVQPLSGRETKRLPEGLRARETMVLFTATEMHQALPESAQEADLVAIDGGTFEVSMAERWAMLGNYYRCIVSRVRS